MFVDTIEYASREEFEPNLTTFVKQTCALFTVKLRKCEGMVVADMVQT